MEQSNGLPDYDKLKTFIDNQDTQWEEVQKLRESIKRNLPRGCPVSIVNKIMDGGPVGEYLSLLGLMIKNKQVNMLRTRHLFDYRRMEKFIGEELIIDRLSKLEMGEIACIRFRHGPEHPLKNVTEYRFRKWERHEDIRMTHVYNRDKYSRDMTDSNKTWYESCFASFRGTVLDNIELMREHDFDRLIPEEMVIISKGEKWTEDDAWLYLQDDMYTHEELEFYGCEIYAKLKEQHRIYDTPVINPEVIERTPIVVNNDIPF